MFSQKLVKARRFPCSFKFMQLKKNSLFCLMLVFYDTGAVTSKFFLKDYNCAGCLVSINAIVAKERGIKHH